MKLVPQTYVMWELHMQREARERGYRLAFVATDNQTAALFFNGPFYCYAHTYTKEGNNGTAHA